MPIFSAFLRVGLLLGLLPLSLAQAAEVQHAWIREAPPGASVWAAYMDIQNASAETIILTGMRSATFKKIEMHRTKLQQGIARMIPQKTIEIAPNSTFSFSPGGVHAMLFQANQPLRAGDPIAITLLFENAAALPIIAEVRKAKGLTHHHHHH